MRQHRLSYSIPIHFLFFPSAATSARMWWNNWFDVENKRTTTAKNRFNGGIVALFGIETYDAIDLATTTTHQSQSQHPRSEWTSSGRVANHLIWSWMELGEETRAMIIFILCVEPNTNRFMSGGGGGVQTLLASSSHRVRIYRLFQSTSKLNNRIK